MARATNMLRASAPGKLFLFGEYGVIRGGWCVVTAVDRRVEASCRPDATGYKSMGADFDDPLALPRAVVAQNRPARCASNVSQNIDVANLSADVRALYDVETGQKLGLGSSAASAVALSAAYLLQNGPLADHSVADSAITRAEREAIFEHAFAAHRALQKGRGSCADIAASAFGTTIGYRLLQPSSGLADVSIGEPAWSTEIQPTTRSNEAEIVADLRIPAGLRVEPIWLGSPARSTSFVRACEVAFARDPAAIERVLRETSAIAEDAIFGLRGADIPAIIACVERADVALDELGERIGAPIITDAHRQLRTLAAAHDIYVKPSGAGGGDFSLAFAPDTADWGAFLESLPPSLRHLPLALGAPGVWRR